MYRSFVQAFDVRLFNYYNCVRDLRCLLPHKDDAFDELCTRRDHRHFVARGIVVGV